MYVGYSNRMADLQHEPVDFEGCSFEQVSVVFHKRTGLASKSGAVYMATIGKSLPEPYKDIAVSTLLF